MKLSRTVQACGTPAFEQAFKAEVEGLDPGQLPLQAGLVGSSCVGSGALSVMLLGAEVSAQRIRARVGVLFTGVDAGSCCADDPSPPDERAEYCELQFDIDRQTAEADVAVIGNQE